MMQYVASCDCGFAEAFKTERGARGGLRRHACDARFIEAVTVHDGSVEDMIRTHRSLALKCAHKLSRRYGIRYDDAYADALIGLWKAAESWDPDKGSSWSSYAWRRITGAIIDGHRDASPFSRTMMREGTCPAIDSLDAPLGSGVNPLSWADLLPDQNDSITAWWDDIDRDEAEAEQERQFAEVMGTVDQLKARDGAIIRAHIGGRTLTDIGFEHGITESRCCQIWKRWLESLQAGVAA